MAGEIVLPRHGPLGTAHHELSHIAHAQRIGHHTHRIAWREGGDAGAQQVDAQLAKACLRVWHIGPIQDIWRAVAVKLGGFHGLKRGSVGALAEVKLPMNKRLLDEGRPIRLSPG